MKSIDDTLTPTSLTWFSTFYTQTLLNNWMTINDEKPQKAIQCWANDDRFLYGVSSVEKTISGLRLTLKTFKRNQRLWSSSCRTSRSVDHANLKFNEIKEKCLIDYVEQAHLSAWQCSQKPFQSSISTWNVFQRTAFSRENIPATRLSVRDELQSHRGIQTENSSSHVRLAR